MFQLVRKPGRPPPGPSGPGARRESAFPRFPEEEISAQCAQETAGPQTKNQSWEMGRSEGRKKVLPGGATPLAAFRASSTAATKWEASWGNFFLTPSASGSPAPPPVARPSGGRLSRQTNPCSRLLSVCRGEVTLGLWEH